MHMESGSVTESHRDFILKRDLRLDQTATIYGDDEVTAEPTSITSKLASKAKLASQIASKQTELAKLQKVTLTSAYIKLGRWAYETKSGQEKIPEHFDALSKINASIRKIKDAEPVPVGDDFKSKAKSMG